MIICPMRLAQMPGYDTIFLWVYAARTIMDKRILEALLRPDAYPEPTSQVSLVETHVSYILITDNFAYKIKKPVDFGFLDFTSAERRRFFCHEEVRLNRRLCPDVYLGVVEVRDAPSGASFIGGRKIIDYAVKMKRLPQERMLDNLLNKGEVSEQDIRNIAGTIARFHLAAVRSDAIDEYGTIAAIRRNWGENFRQVERFIGTALSEKDLNLIRGYVDTNLSDNGPLFAERIKNGFIRDCDGDIHVENICLVEPVCIFDCIEFNDRFRYSDTAADIAFLLMDLDFHRQGEFAGPFLDEYCAVTGDTGVLRLLDFYKTYRAFVRGKVECLRLTDREIREDNRELAIKKAARYFRLARGYVIRNRMRQTIFITCGLMGSGKSSIAEELAFQLGIDKIASDALRKKITGTPPGEHRFVEYGEGIYSQDMDRQVYAKLLRISREALEGGRSVVVDASFRRRSDRSGFASLATGMGLSFRIMHTTCPVEIVKGRLEDRLKEGSAISDGRWELYHRQTDEFEPPSTDEGVVITIDTSAPMDASIDIILGSVELYNGK
jgi:aminoglycoside phosphotransferase family enzyme/predicted kinase